MTTVTEALLSLLRVCDGAHARDEQGFNGRDAEFAHSLGESYSHYGSLTANQERAIHRIMRTYREQLQRMGIDYDALVLECENKRKAETKMWVDGSQYGWKIYVQFPYDKEIAETMKSLPWDKTHRAWDPDNKAWTFDLNDFSVKALARMNFEVPNSIVARVEQTPVEVERGFKIVLGGAFSQIKGNLTKEVNKELSDKMAYQPEGFEYAPSYGDTWDGWIRLYKWHEQRFPTGLLTMVQEVLGEHGIEYVTEDNRKVGEHLDLKWSGPDLREYQEKVLKAALLRGSGFIVMPTGAGKTMLAVRMIHDLGLKTVIFVHRKELLYQWAEVIRKTLGIESGLVGDDIYEEREVTVAMMQTATVHPLSGKYDVMFCDEGHHMPADTFQAVAEGIEARYRFSLSATMRREDNKDLLLWAQTGTMVANITVEDLVREGWLARPKFVILDYEGRLGGYDYQEAYQSLVDSKARNQRIVDYVRDMYQKGHKIYVDVKRIKHGQTLTRMLNDIGVKAVFISGNSATDKRQTVLKTFESDGFVLVSTLIKEGVDLPAMTCVVLAGAGKSGIQVIQTIGRSLRPKPETNEAFVVDLADNGKYLGEHFSQRKEVMKDYYGDLYSPMEV